MDGRKAKKPTDINIKHAANGGYIVRHSYDNMGSGESYMPPREHAFADHKTMMAHVHTHTAGTGGHAAATARAGGVGQAITKKAPGPKSRGAGLD